MATNTYIGARYVPKFFNNNGSSEWVQGVPYEALTIVTYLGNSYTSMVPVPSNAGAPNVATKYWVLTGNYNAQLDTTNRLLDSLQEDYNVLQENLGYVTPEMFGAKGDGITDDTQSFLNAVQAAKTNNDILLLNQANYLLSNTLDLTGVSMCGRQGRKTILTFNQGYIKIEGTRLVYQNFSVINNTGNTAIQVVNFSQNSILNNIYIEAENALSIDKCWYASFINLTLIGTGKGVGINIIATSTGGVNNANFNGIFINNFQNAVEFSGSGNESANNGFFNCTMENITGTLITVTGTMSCWGNKFDTVYCEGVNSAATPCLLLGSSRGSQYITLKNFLLRGTTSATLLCSGKCYLEDLHSVSGGIVCNDSNTIAFNCSNVTYNTAIVYPRIDASMDLIRINPVFQPATAFQPHDVPFKIFALNFTTGAEGSCYFDLFIRNTNGQYYTLSCLLTVQSRANKAKVSIISTASNDAATPLELSTTFSGSSVVVSINYTATYQFNTSYLIHGGLMYRSTSRPTVTPIGEPA